MSPNAVLERSTWDLFWLTVGPGSDVTVIDQPEILALRCPRPVSYLNTVYRTRAKPEQLVKLIAQLKSFHAGVESRWSVVDTTDTLPLERELAKQGYAKSHVHDARVIATSSYRPRPSQKLRVVRVCDEGTLRDCLVTADTAFGTPISLSSVELEAELSKCANPDGRVHRFVAYHGDRPVSSGGMNLFPSLGIGLLWRGGTVPSARGKGAYSAVVAARVGWAQRHGIRFVGLYARRESSSPIVAAQGFEAVGQMTYWTQDLRHSP